MVSTEPKVNINGLYGVKETARLLGVNPSTISRAARSSDPDKALKYHIRKQTGKRVYKGQDIINYWRRIY